jgi:hypothetical protein
MNSDGVVVLVMHSLRPSKGFTPEEPWYFLALANLLESLERMP